MSLTHALECALASGQRSGCRLDHLPGVLFLQFGWAAVSKQSRDYGEPELTWRGIALSVVAVLAFLGLVFVAAG